MNNYNGISSILQSNKTAELSILLYDLFESHDLTNVLVTNELNNSIQLKRKYFTSTSPILIYRLANSKEEFTLDDNDILSHVLQHLLHGDLGKKYLKTILLSLTQECIKYITSFYKEVGRY